eukprot:c5694_g1_i1.p1 GENE.c5694_g1_i1~~c5694_g1_i1.p1  ORF type:complete len:400 (-),score=38.07 c5694_g1_i1:17-1216(-)
MGGVRIFQLPHIAMHKPNNSPAPPQYQLLTEFGIRNLKNYKYDGTDHSMYYQYFASPLAAWLTETFVPLWLAPNAITLLGFSLNVIAHIVLCYFSPNLVEPVPKWAALFCASATLLYQTLDNMDGKQARRTKTSSPLGQLFDHGCDSVSMIMFCLDLAAVLHVREMYLAVCFVLIMSGFYVTIWEEFHTHKFHLPLLNAPNEGLLFVVVICTLGGLKGTDWFDEKTHLYVFTLIFIVAAVTIMSHIVRTVRTTTIHPRWFDEHSPRFRALYRLVPMICIDVYVLWMATTPTVIEMPYVFYWTIGLNFCSFDALFMLKLLCDEEPRLMPKRLWPMLVIPIYSACFHRGLVSFHEKWLLLAYFIGTLFHFCGFVRCIVSELCSALGVKAFTIPSPQIKKSE